LAKAGPTKQTDKKENMKKVIATINMSSAYNRGLAVAAYGLIYKHLCLIKKFGGFY